MATESEKTLKPTLRIDTWSQGLRLESEVLTASRPNIKIREREGACLVEIRKKGDRYRIESLASDFASVLAVRKEYALSELENLVIQLHDREWHFVRTTTPNYEPNIHSVEKKAEIRSQNRQFLKNITQALAGLGLIVLLSAIAHQIKARRAAETPELIPAEIAKLILKPARKADHGSTSSSSRGAPSSAREVAKALGSEAVQNSFAKLNSKAALSKLLQNQSRFLSNWKKDAGLKQLELAQFSSASLAKGLNGSFAGSAGGDRSLSGVGGGAGEGKGYGNGAGTGAGVSGQGQGIVSLETRLAKVEEGLTADEVGEVIHRHAAEIRYCYEDSLLRNPSIEGKLQLLFKISPRGVVSSTEIRSSNLGDARLEDCIIRKLSTWKFPTPKGGIEVPVTYPFVFKNLERSVRAQR